eukprot:jgi/Hompol1/366/HPOL_005296-RA
MSSDSILQTVFLAKAPAPAPFRSAHSSSHQSTGQAKRELLSPSQVQARFVSCAVLGPYYTTTGTFTQDSSFNTQFALSPFPNTLTSYTIDRTYLSTHAYRYGDPIQIYYTSFSSLGYLSLPAALPGGTLCDSQQSALPTLTGTNCTQMVTQVKYTFTYDLSNTVSPVIKAVTIDVVLGSYNIAAGSVLQQKFITSFIPSSKSASTTIQYRSGTPGYIVGSPVLAGTLVQSNGLSAISYNPDPTFGITLPVDIPNTASTANPIQCPSTTNYAQRIPITFGEDSTLGCTLWLPQTSLATSTACATLRKQIYTLQTLTASTLTHIGILGNASIENIYDWVAIINNPPTSLTGTQTVTDIAGTCSSLLTQFSIQILYTLAGSQTNPQRAIVGVKYAYTSGSFTWRCLSQADCVDPTVYGAASSSSAATQPFRIRSTVSFLRVAGIGTTVYSPPAPQLVAKLPDDIWYPFSIPLRTLMAEGSSETTGVGAASRSSAVKRLMREWRDLQASSSTEFHAAPLDDDLLEWHFTIRGPADSEFEGGRYHGRLQFPAKYPFEPPNFTFLNPSGRFEVGKKICLSITGYHPEFWCPAWGVRTALVALISLFPTPGAGAIGALDWPVDSRKAAARASRTWECAVCGNSLLQMLPDTPPGSSDRALPADPLTPVTLQTLSDQSHLATSDLIDSLATSASTSTMLPASSSQQSTVQDTIQDLTQDSDSTRASVSMPVASAAEPVPRPTQSIQPVARLSPSLQQLDLAIMCIIGLAIALAVSKVLL